MDISMLQENISSFAACGNCKKTSCLQILTDPNKKRYGLAEHYLLKCSNCKHEKSCYTSKRTVEAERQSYYDVNIRSVHAAQGMGHDGLSQFCSTMDLPAPVTFRAYNNILKHLSNNSITLAGVMQDASND